MEKTNYTSFDGGFHQVILEESFVLNLKTTMSFVEFQMAFAINEQYPLYTPPAPLEGENPRGVGQDDEFELEIIENETTTEELPQTPISGTDLEAEEPETRYSYRHGRIFFPNMEEVRWQSRIQPYVDPGTGGVDYGAIDYFYSQDGWYYLAGYWGELALRSGPPMLEIDELLQHAKQNKPT